ncbi:MAG: hypothetical protein ACYC1M_10460 [Armatimonadota bacterium]
MRTKPRPNNLAQWPDPPSQTTVKAAVIWPVLTKGVFNREGKQVMDCQIATDGLTVTDRCWDSYMPPSGMGKRWKFNMVPSTDQPLKNMRFDPSLAGMPVNVVVEIFELAKPWMVSESFQQILLLGGNWKAELPAWFRIPVGQLGPNFYEGNWFPSGWSLPKGKFGCWEGSGSYDRPDRNGKNPLLSYGFTQVAENTLTPNGHVPGWSQQCRVFGDAEWLDMKDGGNTSKWHNDGWKGRCQRMQIAIADFENADVWRWNDEQYRKFGEMIGDIRRAYPKCLIGCWGVGSAVHSLRIFDERDEAGRPQGVVNEKAAAQWRAQYDNPMVANNRVLTEGKLNFGNPSVYYLNGGNPAHLYAVVQEWEIGKLLHPDVPNVLSTWIQTEFVDGYPLSVLQFPRPDGTTQVRGVKHSAPPSLTWAMSLFCHTRMDGAYCWEVGNCYSEDPADMGDLSPEGWPIGTPHKVNGKDLSATYYLSYFGFYNYHVLGMWQASQNRDIIEAKTEWLMPEIYTSTGKKWRTGDERYPSYCNWYKEPLVRVKLSADGKLMLVVACNPYNSGTQQVQLRLPGSQKVVKIELTADYPVCKRIRL